jgi:hypothetical protein
MAFPYRTNTPKYMSQEDYVGAIVSRLLGHTLWRDG